MKKPVRKSMNKKPSPQPTPVAESELPLEDDVHEVSAEPTTSIDEVAEKLHKNQDKERQQRISQANRRKVRFAAYLLYNFGQELKFNSVSAADSSFKFNGSATFAAAPAPGLGLEVLRNEANEWGYAAGITYEMSRKFTTVDINLDGALPNNIQFDDPTLSIIALYANGTYRWKEIYLLAGVNHTFPQFKKGAATDGTLSMKGSFGLQGGAGFYFTPQIGGEILLRMVGFSLEGETSDYTYNYEIGYMTAMQINARLHF